MRTVHVFNQAQPPSGLIVPVSSTTGDFTLTWTASADAEGYEIEESATGNFTGIKTYDVLLGTAESYLVTGRAPGTYYYQIRSVHSVMTPSGWAVGSNLCEVPLVAVEPSWSWYPATSSGSQYVKWGASSTPNPIYVIEESTSATFDSVTEVYRGTALKTPVLTGHVNGTYYYRVKVVSAGYVDSPWFENTSGCVVSTVVFAIQPSWIWNPNTSSTNSVYATWGATSTPNPTYVVEESTTAIFDNVKEVYRGTALKTPMLGDRLGGISYYYRVKVVSDGYGDSPWRTGTVGCYVFPPALAPSWVWYPASSTGSQYVTWGASQTPNPTYVVEESTSVTFDSVTEVYRGAALKTPALTGHVNGTYYYRVKVASVDHVDSAWKENITGCVVNTVVNALPTSYVWYPDASSTGSLYVKWGASQTPNPIYVVEESTNANFSSVVEVYRGTALKTPALSGRVNGTYFYRVKVTSVGYADSSWLENTTGCTVNTIVYALSPSYVWYPSASSTGSMYIKWGSSQTPDPTYVVEESTSVTFDSVIEVYRGTALQTPLLTGRVNGTYYYRIKVESVGYSDSPWLENIVGCVVLIN
jgi:hypothetical protein